MWYERNVMYSICIYVIKSCKSHCDLSVLAVSLMSFQKKKKLDRVGGLSSIQFFWIFGIFLTLQSP